MMTMQERKLLNFASPQKRESSKLARDKAKRLDARLRGHDGLAYTGREQPPKNSLGREKPTLPPTS